MFKGPVRTSNNIYVGFRSSEREMGDSSATLSSLILFQHDTEECDLQYHHLLEEFGSVFEATSSFNDQDQCIDFIRSCSQNDYIVLIYVGTLARLTRSGFIDLANLHSIYVYDSVSSIHQRSLVSPSPKIRGTASTIGRSLPKITRWFDARKIRSGVNAENYWTHPSLSRLPSSSSTLCRTSTEFRRKWIWNIHSLLQTAQTSANTPGDLVPCPFRSMGCRSLVNDSQRESVASDHDWLLL